MSPFLVISLFNMQMNIVRMSNIMNIDVKPFDPKTYEADEMFMTDESGKKQQIRLEENVVRWRPVHDGDSTTVSLNIS